MFLNASQFPAPHSGERPLTLPALSDVEPPPPSDSIHKYYDLVTNITHSSAAGTAREETTWKTQVHLRPPRDPESGELLGGKTEEEDEKWFQIQDLIVEEINRGMISLGESYIQVSLPFVFAISRLLLTFDYQRTDLGAPRSSARASGRRDAQAEGQGARRQACRRAWC